MYKFGDPRLPARFWSKVRVDVSGCWLWITSRRAGYGAFSIRRKSHQAHHLAYQQLVGLVPAGLQLDHLCRVRHCVNPAHLEPVTLRENVLRGESFTARNARKTYCPRGHEYSLDNTRIRVRGTGNKSRDCRTCLMDKLQQTAHDRKVYMRMYYLRTRRPMGIRRLHVHMELVP